MHDPIYIFRAITGSVAYGLDTPESDVDRKGIFVFRTEDVLGLEIPNQTITTSNPDFEAHEIGKFFKLALSCNPTIIELMFMPSECVEREDNIFTFIRQNSGRFLSEKKVRDSYGGYAKEQITRIERRMNNLEGEDPSQTDKRVQKHARHCFRLLRQGTQLLETGSLTVRVDPEFRDELFALSDLTVEQIKEKFLAADEEFSAIESNLPAENDREWVNNILVEIRKMNV